MQSIDSKWNSWLLGWSGVNYFSSIEESRRMLFDVRLSEMIEYDKMKVLSKPYRH